MKPSSTMVVTDLPQKPGQASDLHQLTAAYLESLRVRNYSPQTVESQRKQLRWFCQFSEEHGIARTSEVTRDHVLDYQTRLHYYRKRDGQPLAISTQKQWLAAVRSFFGWLVRRGISQANPAADLEMPRSEFRLPRVILNEAEVEIVLNVPDVTKPFGLRDRAILEVLYSTGLRRNEVCRLNTADVDFARGVLRVVQGKGRKDRVVPVGKRALLWISTYLESARSQLRPSPDEHALFVGFQGRRVHPGRLASHIHKLISRAKIGKTGSCHVFRHTFATLLLQNGCDLRHIQAMLGHVKLETTAIYTHVCVLDLCRAHERFHPTNIKRSATVSDDPVLARTS